MVQIDLNCDIGESFGAYTLGMDEEIVKYITSANIACGFHAGDAATMRHTVKLCLEHQVAIGAHPGLPDLQGFGRRKIQIRPSEAYEWVLYQIGALDAIVRTEGGTLHHVKPHGALYNMAASDASIAEAIAEAVFRYNPKLILYGLAGSKLVEMGKTIGLTVANEVFADRTYQADGTLTDREQSGSIITDAQRAIQQVLGLVKDNMVTTQQGKEISLEVETICLHGDHAHAVEFAKMVNKSLDDHHILMSRPLVER